MTETSEGVVLRELPQGLVYVVLPTYNEAENIDRFVTTLLQVFYEHRVDGRLVVVDDGSPDGTGAIADGLAAHDPRVEVLHRPAKEGLGRAYIAGFEVALAAGADFVVQMDSDFSHVPAAVPRLLAAAAANDVVLGSRYVEGGRIERWGIGRRMISRSGCWYARTLLGVKIRDLTGGFKCFRSRVLTGIAYRDTAAMGYAFQIETTYRAIQCGFRVVEIPICFRERERGKSKMSWRVAAEAALLVPRLRFRRQAGGVRNVVPASRRRRFAR